VGSPPVERFFKYQGLGNDFVVVDRRSSGVDLDPATSRAWCDRRLGIGADGVLVILGAQVPRMVVHNADGSIAEMCGNGLRCVVKHLAEAHPQRPARLSVATGAGVLESEIEWAGAEAVRITVAMGAAQLEAASLPNGGPFVDQPIGSVRGTAVSMGNPHLVLLDTPPDRAAQLGPALEVHPLFPMRCNVSFCRARAEGGLEVTVWERGVGLTDACGTGACAAVVANALAGRVAWDAWVPVQLPGGILEIRVKADRSQVWLRGPAVKVYEGSL
jgi:diaminopimelate epimerase